MRSAQGGRTFGIDRNDSPISKAIDMRKLLIIGLLSILGDFQAQDTIVSDAYPAGLVVPTVNMDDYSKKMHPIENAGLDVIILRSEIDRISNSSGLKYVNPEFHRSNSVVVPIEKTTGKVRYVGIIELPGATKTVLYNALKTLPSGVVQYELEATDDTDKSFLKYSGKFNTKFAGDLYDVLFTLTIKVKDGKVKYDCHDFMFCFEEMKKRTKDVMGGNYSIAQRYRTFNPLEKYYVPGYRGDKFWKDIYDSMDDVVKSLQKTCRDFSNGKDGF